MTESELDEFVRQISIAFPGLTKWLQEESPDPTATLRGWLKVLDDVQLFEALYVLERWMDGRLGDPPIGFRRELLALNVRAIVANDRSLFARERQAEQCRIERNRRKPMSAAMNLIYPIYMEFLPKANAVRAGLVSLEEGARIWDGLERKHFPRLHDCDLTRNID